MALLEFQDVHFAYDAAHEVVAGISVALEAGDTVAVVGPNGSGKTTLLRLAGGVLPPQAGRVLLKGRDLAGVARRAAAREVAGLPAEAQALFPFTVREIVSLGRHPWRGPFAPLSADDRGRVDAALAATGMTALAERELPALSSGERQRAAIARCLVQDAEVLLLDEPTAHLDLGQRLRMLRLFRAQARAHGKAVLLVLHDLNLAALAADVVLLLVAGRVRALGPPRAVLTAALIEEAFGARVEILTHAEHGLLVVPLAEAGGEAAP